MYYKVNELGVLNRVLTRDSDYLTKEEYDKRSKNLRIKESLIRLLSPIL